MAGQAGSGRATASTACTGSWGPSRSAVAAFGGAEIVEGNGFIAAFTAGLAMGTIARGSCEDIIDFSEDEGQLLALITFLVFGATIAGPALDELTWQIAAYAVLSLTVVRMVPVAVSLVGAHLRRDTIAFLGWFGPRGLASILFGLLVLEEADLTNGPEIYLIVTWTVLLSVFAHGITAAPLSRSLRRPTRQWPRRDGHRGRHDDRGRAGRRTAHPSRLRPERRRTRTPDAHPAWRYNLEAADRASGELRARCSRSPPRC